MTDRTKWSLLVVLVMVWVGILALRVFTLDEPERVPLKHKSGQSLSRAAAAPASGVPTVAKLGKSREEEIEFRVPKNIFAPLERQMMAANQAAKAGTRVAKASKGEVVPVTATVTPPIRQPSPEELAAQRARQQREMAAQRAHQAMAQYRFIGYLMQNGEPRGFLGKGRELYIVRAGDAVEAQIHVATIDPSTLKLRDLESSVESALPLTKEGGRPGGF